MNVIGYDAMTMGNREFHVADGLLRLKIANAKFPILCANMRYQKVTDDLLPLSPFFSKTLSNGLRVAVIGVTVPMVTSRMTARVISSYLFDDPVNIVSDWVGKLRIDHDVLIALTHIGLKEDQRLAAACPDLDLIIGGHSHAVLSTPQFIEGVPVVQAGWFGHYVGEVLLTVDGTGVRLTQSSLEDVKSFGGRIAT
jgi:2',3'-cyclic-nucleotide 2'-phosphodiesterase (5'-nucleotidase family)